MILKTIIRAGCILVLLSGALRPTAVGAATAYSIGSPNDTETLFLEYINRARANPGAEGQRLKTTTNASVVAAYDGFGVDLNLMASEFAAIPVRPPLAFNSSLLAAARLHSRDMYDNKFQSHTGSDGSTIGDRVTAQGYNYSAYGENVYSSAASAFQGHAGFEVDWGNGTGGMQSPRGHRENIHNSLFREIGIGVVTGTSSGIGPLVVTEDFGKRAAPQPLITGVVYYDFDGDSFYSKGEGIGGVTVTVAGASYYATTVYSGAYAVPVPGNGIYTVTFNVPGMSALQKAVTVSGSNNAKADYVPVYSAPVVTGSSSIPVAIASHYSFNRVGGATGYQFKSGRLVSHNTVEGAETGLTKVTASVSSGYSPVQTELKVSGSAAFHLVTPDFSNQFITLNQTLFPGPTSELRFAKMLGWASSTQSLRVQVREIASSQWKTVWSQNGNGTAGDGSTFKPVAVSLSAYAGKEIAVRFGYIFSGGSAYTQTGSDIGVCLDDIRFVNTRAVTGMTITNVPVGTAFNFTPAISGEYTLRVRALLPSRTLAWGPVFRASAN